MKKLSMLIILVVLITSCATMPNRKVVYIEKTFKQNMIDIGKVILGASIIVGGYAIIQKKSMEKMGEAIRNMKDDPIPIPAITFPMSFPN